MRRLRAAACVSVFTLLAGAQARLLAAQLDLQVELDPAARRFAAVAEVDAPAREFRFALHESLEVSAASANGQALRSERLDGSGPLRAWRVVLPAKSTRLRLEYAGTLPALDRRLDHRAVLHGLTLMAAAEGSFLPAGAGWYPQPAPLFTYTVSLSLPGDQRALVAGRLLSEEAPAAGRYRARFEFARPADGIDLMAGPYRVREKIVPRAEGGPLRLRTYFFPELDAMPGLAEGYLDDAQRYLARYAGEIGAYPFTEFSVVASPLPTGFGMPTLTYLGAEVLKLPFIRATSLGHEVLHNWWGNGVFVDYARGNWSEGLTTFMADYAYKDAESAAAAREMRLGWLRDFASVPAGSQAALAAFRTRTHGAAAAVGYGKAAMLFVMLRDEIGEEAFRRGVRGFWQAQRFKVASWRELQAAFEQAAGRSLAGFFDQWLNRAGAPDVRIAAARATPRGGRAQLALTLEQSSPAYALGVPVELVYAGGRSEMRRIALMQPRQTATLELAAAPEGVRLDPELRLWRRPAAKMKARLDHISPLSDQAAALLQELCAITGNSAHLVPRRDGTQRPIDPARFAYAMRDLALAERASPHCFRATFSTWANERGFRLDAIEKQLAHVPRDAVRAAYDRSLLIDERRTMMQAWADYLTTLEAENVIVSHFGRAA
ncbi:MAG: peptidase M1 [Rhodocyclales bacterium]|nr:MAG: peptidase M1 [Rhodocyclales bacterium]